MSVKILTDSGLEVYDQNMKNLIDKKLEDKVDAEEGKGLSTNDYNDEEKNTVAQNKVDIENIKRQMESYETENKDIVTTTESTLENSYEGGLVINEIQGKTEQNAYTGKNLFSMRKSNTASNGISVTVDNKNQSFSATGTATSSTSINIIDNYDEIKEKLKNGGTFTMSLVNATFDSAKCNISIAYGYNGTTYWIKANGEPITVPSGSSLYSVGLYIPNGTTVNLTDVKIQLEENNVATEWEPYVGGTPSPSPSYPQEIKSVVLNTIKTHGKNLIKGSQTFEDFDRMSIWTKETETYNGLTVLSKNTAWNGVFKNNFYVESGKTYTFSAFVKTSENHSAQLLLLYANISTAEISINSKPIDCTTEWKRFSITFTCTKSGLICPRVESLTDGVRIYVCGYQVEESPTMTEYQPYQETEITLSEPIELNGFNGVYDVVTSDGVTRRFAEKRILPSDIEDIRITSNGNYVYTHELSDVKIYGSCLCTHFVGIGYDDRILNPNSQRCYIDSETKVIYFRDNLENLVFTDLENAKTFFDENEVYLLYELATPTTEELPFVDQIALHSIKTFDGTTYIETDSEIQPIFDVDYGCSQVGATVLESHNNIEINRIIASSLIPDNNTTYELSKENNKIVLTGSDGSKTSVNDNDTVYTHPTSGVTAGTYRSVTVDKNGHVTAGSNPTLTIAQGGTGANDAATARTNLGITPANIGAATDSHTHNSYTNQNAFSNVTVGSTTISADNPTDTLTLVGSNVTLTPDATNDKVTIGITKDNVTNALGYTPPTTNTITTVSTTGNGNAITAISATNGAITATKGSTFLTEHPTISKSTDSTSTASPAHGGTFTVVDSVTRDGNGHVTKVNTKTVTLPEDKNTVYTHPSYTARTGVPTANQTPSFGGTFSVTQPVSDATGHITAMNSRTVTIPNATATTSSAGLMSSSDKTKLDSLTKIELDTTLTKSGKAADAKAVGDAIKDASVSVKYDEDSDYLQVLKDGNFVDTMRMGLLKEYLYIDGLNKGEFYKPGGEGTLSLEGNITFSMPYTVGGDYITRYIRTGKTYDLTNFKTIYMTHTTTFTPQNQYVNFTTTYNWAKLEAADPNNNLAVAASNSYATSANTSGVITLDVSELIGEYYIQIGVHGNQMSANVVISEIYLEG